MRFGKMYSVVTASLLLSTTMATGQTPIQSENNTGPAIVVVPPQRILSVSMPDYARLRLDLDARDEDVLGMVKSLLRGFKGKSLQSVLQSMTGTTAPRGDSSTTAVAPSTSAEKAAALQMLSDTDLGTILKDINHLRFVVFETPRVTGWDSAARRRRIQSSQSVISYYENAYITREGGRRIARGDFDDMQMLAVGFARRGFAIVLQGPGTGIVIRGDGYPDLEAIGPLVMGMGLLFAPRTR